MAKMINKIKVADGTMTIGISNDGEELKALFWMRTSQGYVIETMLSEDDIAALRGILGEMEQQLFRIELNREPEEDELSD